MTNAKFIKIVNHDIYINPNYIVMLDFDRDSEIGYAYGNWERELVYRKDVEHLIS